MDKIDKIPIQNHLYRHKEIFNFTFNKNSQNK